MPPKEKPALNSNCLAQILLTTMHTCRFCAAGGGPIQPIKRRWRRIEHGEQECMGAKHETHLPR